MYEEQDDELWESAEQAKRDGHEKARFESLEESKEGSSESFQTGE